MPLYLPLMFMALPVLIALIAVFVVRQHRRVARAMRTVPAGWVRAPWPGRVTAEETWRTERQGYNTDSTGSIVHRPIVTYRAPSGREVTFRSGLYGTWMPRPGAEVGVFHDPADPARARIAPESIPKTFRRISAVAAVFLVMVLVPLLLIFEGLGYFMLTHR